MDGDVVSERLKVLRHGEHVCLAAADGAHAEGAEEQLHRRLASSVVQRSTSGSPNSWSLGTSPTRRYPKWRSYQAMVEGRSAFVTTRRAPASRIRRIRSSWSARPTPRSRCSGAT